MPTPARIFAPSHFLGTQMDDAIFFRFMYLLRPQRMASLDCVICLAYSAIILLLSALSCFLINYTMSNFRCCCYTNLFLANIEFNLLLNAQQSTCAATLLFIHFYSYCNNVYRAEISFASLIAL